MISKKKKEFKEDKAIPTSPLKTLLDKHINL
jgi:hypothetical protein